MKTKLLQIFRSSTNLITDQYLVNIEFTREFRIICKLDPNKVHGHDIIITGMLKMSGNVIIQSLFTIFNFFKKCEIFSDDWKNGNIVPIIKKRQQAKHKKLSSSLSSSDLQQGSRTYHIR